MFTGNLNITLHAQLPALLIFWATRLTVKVVGKHNIPKKGPLVVYANHKSLNDPLILLQVFNRNLSFTPKKSLYKIWFLKTWFNAIGCFPIDRENDRETAKKYD